MNTRIISIEIEKMPTVAMKHIGWTGHGKSRLCQVSVPYDVISCETEYDYVSSNDNDHDHDNVESIRNPPNFKLKMPVPRHLQKKTYPVLIVGKRTKKS